MSILERFFDSVNSLGPFEEKCHVAVALSGGSDSLALTILLSEWVKQKGYSLTALLVNHNLRKEAGDEIICTTRILDQKGINYELLNIDSNKIGKSNIQENARFYRYSELTKYCRLNNIIHLFTGHTCNDQIENFFIRLTRGTSLNGLSGIKKISVNQNVRILRPLLGFYKEDLQKFLSSQNLNWVEDPSNKNTDFTRVKARELINSKEFLALSNQKDQKILFNRIRNVVDEISLANKENEDSLLCFMTKNVTFYPEGYCKLYIDDFHLQKKDIILRTIAQIVRTVGNQDNTHPARLAALENLYMEILKKEPFKKTLGHCIINYNGKNDFITFLPEKMEFSCAENDAGDLLINKKYRLFGYQKPQIKKFISNKHTMGHLPYEIRQQLFTFEALTGKKVISFLDNEHYNNVRLEFFPQAGLAENYFDN